MQRLRRLQTPRLYQDWLLHLESLTAAQLGMPPPPAEKRRQLELGVFFLSVPSRAVATVCPHRGRGELGSEDQLGKGEIALYCSISWVLDRQRRWSNPGGTFRRLQPRKHRLRRRGGGPKATAGRGPRGAAGGLGLPRAPRRPREPGPGYEVPVVDATDEAARCAAFSSVMGGAKPGVFPGLGVPSTCSNDPTLVREFFNPLPRGTEPIRETMVFRMATPDSVLRD